MRVFVSGATRGIGKVIAEKLLMEGFQVTIHGKSESEHARDAVRELEEKLELQVPVLYFDVANRDQAREILQQDVESNGAYYGIVCNAGITADAPLAGMEYEQWRNVLSTNLDSFYHIVQPLMLPMIRLRSGGRIVVMSSVSGIMGNRGQVNYSASKAGLIGATKALARELASRKITVNCVAPGPVGTEMLPDQMKEKLLSSIPMQRFGLPEEVAHAVRFFFHPEAEYITGQVLSVSGGMV